MNRDRDPTQVITSPTTPIPSSTTIATPPTSLPPSATTSTADPLSGLSKIKQTALLLKQKVAGTNTKPQKQPNKISHPWSLNPSSRRASFSSPSSSSSFSSPASPPLGGGGGGKTLGIKAMIAAREDPSLSCNKMAPPGTQPIPAPQKREAKAGMTKLQLSQPLPPPAAAAPAASVDTVAGPDRNDGQSTEKENEREKEKEKERRRRQTKRESIQEQQTTSPTATTPPPAITPPAAVMESIPAPTEATTESTTATDLAGKRSSRRRNGVAALIPSQFTPTPSPSSSSPPSSSSSSTPSSLLSCTTTPSSSTSSSGSSVRPAFMKAFEDIRPIETVKTSSASEESPSTSSTTVTTTTERTATTKRSSLMTSALPPLSPSLASPPVITTGKTQPATVFNRPSLTPRRHTTTNSPSSPLTSSPFVPTRHPTPPVPLIPGLPVAAGMTSHHHHSHHQTMSLTNPTLRQLQTPNIPTNLVQARILQQEEQKRKDEELAKIPITANLRQVKKIQAVLVSDDEDDDPKSKGRSSSASSSASSSLSAGTSTRPRSKTATATSQTSVPVSVLVGGKRRGDRNHVEPVAIPKRLADQVEHILGRKLAGKGNVLDEREQEREEEEARKAAEPLPPIVLGKPRKRAMTSAHIRNLVSSWDTKVEEAKELTSEAERIRLFLEERSTAHAEMPKPKVAPTAEELLRPLPALPPPPSPSELHQLLVSGGVVSSGSGTNLDAAGIGSVGRRRGRTVATSNGSGSGRSFGGHMKGASVASVSPSTTVQPLQKTKILLSTPSQSSFVPAASGTTSNSKAVVVENAALGAEPKDVETNGVTAVEVEPITRRSVLSTEALDTSKRTGELLVSKAAINRPRRKRATTVTQGAL